MELLVNKLKLSQALYNEIHQHCKSKHINAIVYDKIRSDRYGKKEQSYDGQGECGKVSRFVQDYLFTQGIKTRLHYSTKGAWVMQKWNLSCYDHMFLRTADDLDMIIDPTWKQLYFQKSGKTEKWFSKYAEFLYTCHPVFVGTDRELDEMISKLYEMRQGDFLHKDDVWITDWHKSATSIQK
jgi:hypothetical protein